MADRIRVASLRRPSINTPGPVRKFNGPPPRPPGVAPTGLMLTQGLR